MLVSDFSYRLPQKNIAIRPPKTRGTSRLLTLNRKTGAMSDAFYAQLSDFLVPGDAVVINDTRVMRARLFGALPDGRIRELVVLEKHTGAINHLMYRGRLHAGDVLTILQADGKSKSPDQITVKQILGDGVAVVEGAKSLPELAELYGTVPLPPYLHRHSDASDLERYQTIWAKHIGSAAAPTASLNMTKELLDRIAQKGVIIKHITLHVGLGTFLPIRTDTVEEHQMHSEWFNIPVETITAIQASKAAGHRVVAIGTTVTRTLEYWGNTNLTSGEDKLFIYPGYKFRVVDALLTNFHAPKSSVLMLAAAFAGWQNLKPAYEHAIKSGYKLLSYGDSMFIY